LDESIGQAIIVTLDITERKQMEEALRQSEERFVQFMEHLPGLAWIKDLQGRYVYTNAAAEKAFNASREQVYGKTDQEIFPSEIAAQFIKNDEQALIERKGVQVIETLKQADSILHYSLVNKFPIPGLNDEITLIGGTAFDITERKRAEEALRESEERYRSLFDLVPVAVYTCDADGLIREYNHRAAELWGREPAKNDPSEKYCGSFKIYYPDGRFMAHKDCPMARILKGEILDPQELEILIERPDGVRRSVIAHPLPIRNERGEIVEAINCLYDITERKQAEDALQLLNLQLENRVEIRTVELQQANSALQESRRRLQILSQRLVEVQEEERRAIARELHDRVGQSLSALNINMIIMRDQLLPDSLERVGPRLNDSMHLVGETITLVRDVMSNLRPAVLDDYGLEAALQSHVDEYMSRYEIKVVLERPAQLIPRLGSSIEMTFLRIAQEALINIARHANASQVTLSLWQEGDSICMKVQDNGNGIVSWQQANRPGSHGLIIMRERAEAVGGSLNVASVPGKGTKVEMSIPIGKASQNEFQKEMLE
jgi:PAS domain S-box-containing protein